MNIFDKKSDSTPITIEDVEACRDEILNYDPANKKWPLFLPASSKKMLKKYKMDVKYARAKVNPDIEKIIFSDGEEWH